jgi:aspartokinase-like uncharacterized kinase
VPEPGLTVLKLGGAVCRDPSTRKAALEATGRLARRRRVLIVPGGGAFADEVRATQQAQGFSEDIAHWMAILAMDQLARVIAAELGGSQLIHLRNEVEAVHDAGRIPVLAPHAWMRAADPLPHSWDITSDSIAAFVAGALDATELILLKPVEGPLDALVDRGFATARPPGMRVRIATPATLEVGSAAS